DDNASGVALLIDVARYLSANQPKGTRRTMVFQAFGAEEPGLWGSKYAAVHPPLPIETVTAMVNMDMVGRLRQNRLSIHGAGSSSEWPSLVNTVNTDQLLLDFTAQPQGASDHLTYFLREKPVLHLTTGGHDQYHTPDDDVGLINYKGMSRIGGLVARLVSGLATRPEPLPVNPVVPE
ncbi:MAG: M28 family peptidase, partial [Candidatus Marinimicrobia bacterium]|nr:M28 family peptidase [Candidatus Neomarinimicrobiota bacterium]